MASFVEGVCARFYRAFGPDTQYVGPFGRVNFVIGANNSGKSCLLSLIKQATRSSTGGNIKPLDPKEVYQGPEAGEFFLGLGAETDQLEGRLLARLSSLQPYEQVQARKDASEIIRRLSHNGLVWVSNLGNRDIVLPPGVSLRDLVGWGVNWAHLWTPLTGTSGGSALEHWIPQTLQVIAQCAQPAIPQVHTIPAKRQIGRKGELFDDLSGKGLLDHLAQLQNPSFTRRHDQTRFRKINQFVKDILSSEDCQIEIPNDLEHVLVHIDGKVLPLEAFGTGVHEVILIASLCTIHDGDVICIEEPEIHLHPILQKKLARYLMVETEGQYFISTHSPSFIDTPGASIFHAINDGVQTLVNSVITKHDKRSILDSIGASASDILQANSVVWVEGPSDRIYLIHWISTLDPSLSEGIHYTIMFYGGGLIAHLSASDDTLTDFIKLRDLNRHMAIVVDSDRETAESPLKPNAERILEETRSGPGVAWITLGREIENYVDAKILQSALKQIHPKIYVSPASTGPYDHAFYFYRMSSKDGTRRSLEKGGDKVGAANIVCQESANLDVLDLRDRVSEVVAMIRAANGLDPL